VTRAVDQCGRSAIVDAPAKSLVERIDGVLNGLVPTGIFGCERLELARRRPGFLRFSVGGNEGHHVDQSTAGDRVQQEAAAGSDPERGILEIAGPGEPLGGNQSPIGHDAFA
jgi:hypothetical protein